MDGLLAPGLGDSHRQVLDHLKRRGPATLAELEGALGLARETLRDHLRSLAAQGLVERAGSRRQGPGRPQGIHRLSAHGEALFPHREGELLRELATFLLAEGHEEVLAGFLEDRAEGKRARLRTRVDGLAGRERVAEVARILSEEGFVAEASPDGERLRLCHCPLAELVAVTQLPCRAELALVSDLLGRPLHRESFLPDGASSCTYALGPASDEVPLAALRRSP